MRSFWAISAAFVGVSSFTSLAAAADGVSVSQFDKMFFFSVEGGYAITAGAPTVIIAGLATSPVGNGPRLAVEGGVRLQNGWDIEAGGGLVNLGTVTTPNAGLNSTSDARNYSADLEVGFSPVLEDDGTIRVFGGLRYGNWHNNASLPASAGAGTPASFNVDTWGLGPRVGIEGSHRLGDTPISIFAEGSASYLVGRLDESGAISGPFPAPTQSRSNAMLNLDAKIGASVEVAPGISIGAGYQASYWSNATLAEYTGALGGPGSGSASRASHGPFVTIGGKL